MDTSFRHKNSKQRVRFTGEFNLLTFQLRILKVDISCTGKMTSGV